MTRDPSPDNRPGRATLERLHDGDLRADERSRVQAILERDESLRAELRDVRAADALIREALISPRPTRSFRPIAWALLGVAGVGVAAAALAIAAIVGVPARPGPTPELEPQPRIAANTPSADRQVTSGASSASITGERTVVSASDVRRSRVLFGVSGSPVPEEHRVERALRDARPRAIVDQLRSDDPQTREQTALTLGRAIRSARAAEEALDALSPGEQLGVIRLWAQDASLRPFAFDRLERLAASDAVGDDALDLARSLARSPELSPWILSRRTLRSAVH